MVKHIFATAVLAAGLVVPAAAQDNITWTEVTGSLTGIVGGIQMHGSAANKIDNQWYIYAIGGNRVEFGGDSENISYAALDLDPVSVGAWTTATALLHRNGDDLLDASAYIERATFFYNNRLYKVGGNNNGTPPGDNTIRVYETDATGNVTGENLALAFDGEAAGVTPSLGSAALSTAFDPSTGYLYVAGGSSSDTSVRRFKIDATTGAVSDYQLYPGVLVYAPYFSSGAVIKGGYLYIIDSHNAVDRGKVQFAEINGDGTLGTFAQTTSLPAPHIDGGSAVVNNEIYVVAGHTGGGNTAVTNTVHRSVSGPDGTITSWVEEPAIPIDGGLRRVGVASLGDEGFVVIGGRNNATFPPNVWVAKSTVASVNDWSVY